MTTGPPHRSSKATLFTICSIKQLSDWLGIGLTNGATMLTAQNCQCYVCVPLSRIPKSGFPFHVLSMYYNTVDNGNVIPCVQLSTNVN